MTLRHHFPLIKLVFSRVFFSCLLLAGAITGVSTVQAAEQGLTVSDPWMRFIIPARPAAGYFVLANKTSRSRTLVGASSPACGMLMLHRSVGESGVEQMAMVKDVKVPAHGSVSFSPGGYHLMCMSPTAAMIPGHSVPVTLRFKNGDEVTASFSVRGALGK